MPNDEPVLIDTSVWIEYLSKKNSSLLESVDQLLDNARVACATIILAELIQGAKTEKEVKQLKAFFQPLSWIQSNDEHWMKAGELSFRLKRSGKTVNLTDCYIASLAESSSALVFTLDKDFQWITQLKGCRLFAPAETG